MNPASRVAQPEDLPPRGPLGAMYAIPEMHVRLAVKRLDTFSARRHGRVQAAVVQKLLSGGLAICRGLLILMRTHVARSASREEAEAFRDVLATIDTLFVAEVDAKFGAAPVPDFAVATQAESRAEYALNLRQNEAGLTPSPEVCDRIVVAALRKKVALDALIAAAQRRAAMALTPPSGLRGVS